MATDVEIEERRAGEIIYTEPDDDPYESELASVVDEHDYNDLGKVPCRPTDNTEFKVA